jgi:Tfp pilus assembly protein PilV
VNKPTPLPTPPLLRRHRSQGFALLITITLLAFLVLLLVSLASLTRVETQVAGNSQSLAQARQNALMALNMAIGQLQKTAGPDQRVTARSDVGIPSGVTVIASTTGAAAQASIDTYWRAKRNRQWTGVWLNTKNNPSDYDPNNPAAFNPVPVLQSWLVSGNEKAADFSPETQLTGLSVTASPDIPLTDANGVLHRLLVGARTTGATSNATDLDRLVTAPQQDIKSTGVPGTDGSATTVGHYAWWVGDEGIKARANLVDTYAATSTPEAERIRRQSAQRPAIEAMTGLTTDYPSNSADLLNVFTPAQLTYLNPAATFPAALKTRYHDLSVTSRGVLADVKDGGLKADLTYHFGRTTLADFRTSLRALYGTNDIAPINANAGDLSANPLINSVAALRATFPSTASFAPEFVNTATWEQLWSFANQGSSFDSSGRAAPRLHAATQHGLYPLVIQTKMFFRLRFVGGAPDADGVNRTGTLSIDTIPVVLLANPYAVPLAPADYQFRVSGSNPQLVFGNTDDTDAPDTDFSTRAYPNTSGGSSTEPTYAGNITFVLRTTGMAAGEAQIFTIDPDNQPSGTTIDAEDRIIVVNSNDAKQVYMKNDFDPSPALTFNTPKTVPAANTRAALRSSAGSLVTRLYINYASSQGNLRLIQMVNAQSYRDSTFTGSNLYTLTVDPMSDGIRQGGGAIASLPQPPTTDNPAAKPGVGSKLFTHQQAPFLQVNYRTTTATWNAPNSAISHPLEWARCFMKNGSNGSSGTTPSPWLGANLLRPSGSTTTARWGLVNIGQGNSQTVPPDSIGGSSASDVGFINYLYDIPRPDNPLSSLGQLQHFNATGYIPVTGTPNNSVMNSWQTNYPISNSYPQPRVPRDRLFNYVNGGSVSLGYHYDGSSLWNDVLWDRFYFSTYPQSGDFDFASGKLINSRYRPFRDRSAVAWDDETKFRGDGDPSKAANALAASQNLLVDGAFNINSTSVEAWKAVFSSLKKVPVGTESVPSAPFSRTLTPSAGSAGAASGTSANSWSGFRDLSPAEIQTLAEEMVLQVRKRGPFTSLSEFVNRRLVATAADTYGLGLSGALQAALDLAVNPTSNLAPSFKVKSSAVSSTSATNPDHIAFSEIGYILPAALAGFPGYVLQGDVLSSLGATLSARSDTFTIRTYGDSVNPATGEVTGRAWCEAVVQRTPDYVDSTPAANTPAAGSPAETFGRRYQVVSFRWLSPEDI